MCDKTRPVLEIYIDADACPVKEDAYRVAKRYGLKVFVVSHHPIHVPQDDGIEAVVVEKRFDAVDDYIVEKAQADDIVITNDILLAARCLEKQARVIDPRGKVLSFDNIGDSLATRELMAELRQRGELKLGPKKMGKTHRSHFLSALDEVIHAVRKKYR